MPPRATSKNRRPTARQPKKPVKSPPKKTTAPSKQPGRQPVRDQAQLEQLMLADLARSGLTAADAKRLELRCVTSAELVQLTARRGVAKGGYVIPYHDEHGQPTGSYRVRLLEPGARFVDRKTVRYLQPPGTLPHVYLARGVRWPQVLDSAKQELWITEGEKKAARGCRAGYHVLGLGGVWSWRSTKAGVNFLPQLAKIVWDKRTVVMAFDSDVMLKSDVQRALTALAFELKERGAVVLGVSLGSAAEKIGLDDFLEQRGDAALGRLERAPVLADTDHLLQTLNDELAVITNLGEVWALGTRTLLSRQTLVGVTYANRRAVIATREGEQEKNLAAEWLTWPGRREHAALTYAPGELPVTKTNHLNLWTGLGVEPAKGDVTPFAQLIKHLFGNAPEHQRWVLQWLAYPLQHPGAKLYSAVVLFSLHQGVGKSLLGLTLGKIYGRNFSEISQEQLHGNFNEWAASKQFILGDEITARDNQERRRDIDRIKAMITREQLTVNGKYQRPYTITDCVNYFFTTQHPDAFLLDDNDRRFFVHEITSPPQPLTFYQRYDRWLRSDVGAGALLYHLLNLDLVGFNPLAPAPMTEAKRDMIDLSRSDLDTWAAALKADPDGTLRFDGVVLKRQLWTTAELRAFTDQTHPVSLIALAKALRRAGLRQLPPVMTSTGTRKLWAVREPARWFALTHGQRVAAYERDRELSEPRAAKKY
jgi:hypothetical protein